MAQVDDIQIAAKLAYDKVEHEFGVKGDLLQNIFTHPDVYSTATKYIDFVGKVPPVHDLDGVNLRDQSGINPTDPAVRAGSRGEATIPRSDLLWRRREVRSFKSRIHLEAARAQAQAIGLEGEAFKQLISNAAAYAMRDAKLGHIIELLISSYRETTSNTDPSLSELPFPVTSKILTPFQDEPGSTALGDRRLRALGVEDIFEINEIIDNAVEIPKEQGALLRPGLEKVKRVCIIGHTGWSDFLHENFGVRQIVDQHVIGNNQNRNYDWHEHDKRGRKNDLDMINIKGYGMFPMIDGTLFISVPDYYMAPYSTNAVTNDPGGAGVTTGLPYVKTRQILWNTNGGERIKRGEVLGATTQGISNEGLDRAIILSARAFSLHKPKHLGVPGHIYRDKDSSFEESLYMETVTSGIRRYDEAVMHVFFPANDLVAASLRTTP